MMRTIPALLIAVCAISTASNAHAYSSTSDCDRWDMARLSSVGIRVGAYAHRLQKENSRRKWIYVEFDCSSIPVDREVLLTCNLRTKSGTSANFRAERSKDNPNKLVLSLALSEDLIEHSRIVIAIWERTADGGSQQYGYKLSCKRIVQLIRERVEIAERPAASE